MRPEYSLLSHLTVQFSDHHMVTYDDKGYTNGPIFNSLRSQCHSSLQRSWTVKYWSSEKLHKQKMTKEYMQQA